MRDGAWLCAMVVVASCLAAAPVHGQDAEASGDDDWSRVLVGLEGAVLFPITEPQVQQYYPGGTVSVAAQWTVTKYLAPLVRLRAGWLSAQERNAAHLMSASLGLRFRPRGIAFPDEPSRASCIWAEADISVAGWNGQTRLAYEGAIGFGFVVDDVTLGPVVRFVHVVEFGSLPQSYLMTAGLEVLLNDAR